MFYAWGNSLLILNYCERKVYHRKRSFCRRRPRRQKHANFLSTRCGFWERIKRDGRRDKINSESSLITPHANFLGQNGKIKIAHRNLSNSCTPGGFVCIHKKITSLSALETFSDQNALERSIGNQYADEKRGRKKRLRAITAGARPTSLGSLFGHELSWSNFIAAATALSLGKLPKSLSSLPQAQPLLSVACSIRLTKHLHGLLSGVNN